MRNSIRLGLSVEHREVWRDHSEQNEEHHHPLGDMERPYVVEVETETNDADYRKADDRGSELLGPRLVIKWEHVQIPLSNLMRNWRLMPLIFYTASNRSTVGLAIDDCQRRIYATLVGGAWVDAYLALWAARAMRVAV